MLCKCIEIHIAEFCFPIWYNIYIPKQICKLPFSQMCYCSNRFLLFFIHAIFKHTVQRWY